MRNLLITVGAPASGKSTWIKENGLEPYTISPDTLRLLISAPEYNLEGKQVISQKNDTQAWKLLDSLLEQRMAEGHFTVVDATHTREKYLNRYKKLCDQYRYRLYVKRFDVPLEELVRRNSERDDYKRVPEEALKLHAERLKNLKIAASIAQIERLDEINEFIRYMPMDVPVYFIGDIQGTFEPLKKFLDEHFTTEGAHFVFIGDYLDRGRENDQVLTRMMELAHARNVTLLEGNHERHIWHWANGALDKIRSREFLLRTMPQIDGIDKKEVRQFYRKLRTFASYDIGGRRVFACHGGLPHGHTHFISTNQLIEGVGKYEELGEIYASVEKAGDVTMVHGHRNIPRYPTKVSDRIFNLDGSVEFGGSLRAVRFNVDGTEDVFEYRNENYVPYEDDVPVDESAIKDVVLINKLRESTLVRENKFGHISAFNFTRGVFRRKDWNLFTIKARGLFVNNNTNRVVARSYNKFFNFNELEETSEFGLSKKVQFPVTVWHKYNGFLGIVGYDPQEDKVLYCSKSTVGGDFAVLAKEVLDGCGVTEEKLKPIVSKGYSLVFEIVEPAKDPHIIEYGGAFCTLLDVIENDFVYKKLPHDEALAIASELGCSYKERKTVLHDIPELFEFMKREAAEAEHEGYVFEDAAGYMWKLKTDFYSRWKQLRYLKDTVFKAHVRISDKVFDDESLGFLNWAKQQDEEFIRRTNIIELRKLYHSTL